MCVHIQRRCIHHALQTEMMARAAFKSIPVSGGYRARNFEKLEPGPAGPAGGSKSLSQSESELEHSRCQAAAAGGTPPGFRGY